MRSIHKVQAAQDYFKHFQSLIASGKSALVWQLGEEGQQRQLFRVSFISCRREDDQLKVECLEKNREFNLPGDHLYFYVEGSQLMFRAPKINVEGHMFLGALPEELLALNEEEHEKILQALSSVDPSKKEYLLDYSQFKKTPERSQRDKDIFEDELNFVALDEEDRIYADQRGAPRARPAEGRMVSVQKLQEAQPKIFQLFDLSRGGLGILAFSEKDFKVGEVVRITAFDNKIFDDPMMAEVKSARPVDEQALQFKIGMMFI